MKKRLVKIDETALDSSFGCLALAGKDQLFWLGFELVLLTRQRDSHSKKNNKLVEKLQYGSNRIVDKYGVF